jgi:uncharacterized protein
MALSEIVTSAYLFFLRKRLLLFAATGAIILLSLLSLQRIELNENVMSMLPDGNGNIVADFDLLKKSPFSRKLIVQLRAGPGVSEDELIAATDKLAGRLIPPLFTRVITGPGAGSWQNLLDWLRDSQACLTSAEDLEVIQKLLTDEAVRKRLGQMRAILVSPEGIGFKRIFSADPFGWFPIYLEKLRFLNPMPGVRLGRGRFLSAEGNNSLILIDTGVDFTDVMQSNRMLASLHEISKTTVPAGIEVMLVSGHRYTLANSERVKKDLTVVLSVAAIGIFTIFMFFMRTWSALWVFFLPVAVLIIASAGVAIAYQPVSAITLGFGAVLLGITNDYPIHVHAGLSRRDRPPAEVLSNVFPPLVFSGLTTMVVFGILLFSSLQVQRQLAVFSLIGIIAAFLLSLFVLPHLIGPTKTQPRVATSGRPPTSKRSPLWIIVCWGGILGLSLWGCSRLQFNGDLKAMNFVTEDIKHAEAALRDVWGDFRNRAMVFVEGPDLRTALARNEELFKYLQPRMGSESILSLAPILPSDQTQEFNLNRWQSFWSLDRKESARRNLEGEGRRQGFRPEAFESVWRQLETPPSKITVESLRAAGLGDLIDSLILSSEKGVQVITLIPDTSETAAFFKAGAGSPPGVKFVSQRQFSRNITAVIAHDFSFFFGCSLVAICLLLAGFFRQPIKVLLALIPVGTGLIGAAGFMGALGYPVNLFNVVASILIMGLGVDYGIFMVSRLGQGRDRITELAVLLCSLTTLVGFGSLSFARHPALNSIGLAVLLGIGGAAISSLVVIPAFYRIAWVVKALTKGIEHEPGAS